MGWGSATAQYAGREIGTPNRGTPEQQLDAWNQQLRASPLYQNFMRSRGLPTDGRVKLSRQQQSDLERELARNGIQIPGGMHIDQGGNLNQKNRTGRNVAIAAGIAGAAFGGAAALGAFSGPAAAGGTAAGAGGAAAGGGSLGGGLASAGALGGASAAAPVFTAAGTGAATGGYGAALGTGAALGGSSLGGGLSTPAAVSGGAPLATTGGYTAAGTTPALQAAQAGTGGGSIWSDPYIYSQIANAGLSYLSGRQSANAARDASQQQMAAVEKAMAYNDRLYNDARATQHAAYARGQEGLAPYQGYGTAALTSLGNLMGYGQVQLPAPVAPLAPPPGQLGPVSAPTGGDVAIPRATPIPVDGMSQGVAGSVRAPQLPPQQTAQMQTASAYAPRSLGSVAGVVKLRAPNGDEMTFPAGHPDIQRALGAGAQQVA